MSREDSTLFRFDLTDEPWIPCIRLDGEQPELLSLRTVLARAETIRAIVDASPLVTVVLHRLLLAILHRTVGPRSIATWRAMWEQRAWDVPRIEAYLDRWRNRFDLFDEAHPFYQTPGLDANQAGPISKLFVELASGNNRTLFDHSIDHRPRLLFPDVVARALVAHQAFALGGLVSARPGEDRSAKAAPLTKAAVSLMAGRNLFETLMLNLHRYTHEDPFPSSDDRPAWERDDPTRPAERTPLGYLDLLTWQSRRIRLCPEHADGRVVVRHVTIMKGYQLPDGFSLRERDTMIAFRRILRPIAGGLPWLAVGFQEDRALWRDSLAFLQSLAEQRTRPAMLDWLYELVDAGALSRAATLPLEFFGLSSDRALALLWRRDRLSLPLAYLDGDRGITLVETLGRGLTLAEEAGQALDRATRRLAETILSAGTRRGDPRQVRELSARLATGRAYWPAVELPFRQLLADLPAGTDQGESASSQTLVFRRWVLAVRDAAQAAHATATAGMDNTARALRASAESERLLRAELARLTAPYLTEASHAATG